VPCTAAAVWCRTRAVSGRFPLREQCASQAGADLATRAEIPTDLPRCTGLVVRTSPGTNCHTPTGDQQMWVSPFLYFSLNGN